MLFFKQRHYDLIKNTVLGLSTAATTGGFITATTGMVMLFCNQATEDSDLVIAAGLSSMLGGFLILGISTCLNQCIDIQLDTSESSRLIN